MRRVRVSFFLLTAGSVGHFLRRCTLEGLPRPVLGGPPPLFAVFPYFRARTSNPAPASAHVPLPLSVSLLGSCGLFCLCIFSRPPVGNSLGLLIHALPRRRWAFPHSAYRRGSPSTDAATLSTLVTSSAAVAVVAGYPIPTPGGVSPAADVDAYVTSLVVSGLGGGSGEGGLRAVALADERWSSVRARDALGIGVGTGQGGRGGGWRTWRGGARRAKEAVDAVRWPA